MASTNYPLSIMHDYRVGGEELADFLKTGLKAGLETLGGWSSVSKSRRALLPYGAVVLVELIERMKPADVATSAFGVREGYLFSLLDAETRAKDPLITATGEMALLRARSPKHSHELIDWTGRAFEALDVDETVSERRYRQAACLMADIVWRAHPEYRASQAIALMTNGNFVGVDHPGRVFIALANAFRHMKKYDVPVAVELRSLISDRLYARAQLIGVLMRVAYLISASMPGMLPKAKFSVDETGAFVIGWPRSAEDFRGEALDTRVQALSRFLEREVVLQFG